MKNRNIPFGYKFEGGKIVVNASEHTTIQRICSEYLNGLSLLQIAYGLQTNKVEYIPGKTSWNKARIMRIIDDKRYLGDSVYPKLIDEITFEKMQARKDSQNTQAGTNRQSGIYLLNIPIICSSCGGHMRRFQDKRCNCSQKWVCSNCKTVIKKEDDQLLDEVTDLLNHLIRDPKIIHTPQFKQIEPSVEQRRLDNEISRSLEGYDFDKDILREKLFQRAAQRYQQIGNESYTENKLRHILEQATILRDFDSEPANKIVKQIILSSNDPIRIVLINNQKIRKEKTDRANREQPNIAL